MSAEQMTVTVCNRWGSHEEKRPIANVSNNKPFPELHWGETCHYNGLNECIILQEVSPD